MWVLSAFSTILATTLTGFLWLRAQKISINEQLQATAATFISLGISDFSELVDFDKFDEFIEDTLQMEKVNKIIRVYDGSQNLAFSSVASDFDEIPALPSSALSKPTLLTLQGRQDHYQSLIVPYDVKDGGGRFFLQILIPLPRVSQILRNLWWESLALLGSLTLFSLLLSHYLSRRLLQPVEDIAVHLGEIDPNRIEEWAPIPVNPEGEYLAAISSGINSLIERTRASVLQIKKMGRYVAHEMRTPLTILQGEAENVLSKPGADAQEYRQVLRSSLEEVQRLSEIVTTVLQVGKVDQAVAFQATTLDLGEWLRSNLGEWESALNRPIPTKIEPGIRIESDPKLLHRLVDNLMRNIRNHSPVGTPCELRLSQTELGPVLSVLDRGPGIEPLKIESLNREGPHSEAAGVGLNLCFAIAQRLGFELRFSINEPQGLRVDLRFPAS